jgi:hypothetical protein
MAGASLGDSPEDEVGPVPGLRGNGLGVSVGP